MNAQTPATTSANRIHPRIQALLDKSPCVISPEMCGLLCQEADDIKHIITADNFDDAHYSLAGLAGRLIVDGRPTRCGWDVSGDTYGSPFWLELWLAGEILCYASAVLSPLDDPMYQLKNQYPEEWAVWIDAMIESDGYRVDTPEDRAYYEQSLLDEQCLFEDGYDGP